MESKLAIIKDVISYLKKSRHWFLIVTFLMLAMVLSFIFIYHADNTTETNLVNSITIITTVLAFLLLFSDFHRNWRESREKRLTALFYQKDSTNNKPVIMFYYRATLGGESDIRALTQQLGSEIIQLGIGKNKGCIETRLNLNVASNYYKQLPKILQDKNDTMVQDYISITALYDWAETACKEKPKMHTEDDIKYLREAKKIMQDKINNQQIYFAKGDSDEQKWAFTTWDEIAKQIDPEIKAIIENYAIENQLMLFRASSTPTTLV